MWNFHSTNQNFLSKILRPMMIFKQVLSQFSLILRARTCNVHCNKEIKKDIARNYVSNASFYAPVVNVMILPKTWRSFSLLSTLLCLSLENLAFACNKNSLQKWKGNCLMKNSEKLSLCFTSFAGPITFLPFPVTMVWPASRFFRRNLLNVSPVFTFFGKIYIQTILFGSWEVNENPENDLEKFLNKVFWLKKPDISNEEKLQFGMVSFLLVAWKSSSMTKKPGNVVGKCVFHFVKMVPLWVPIEIVTQKLRYIRLSSFSKNDTSDQDLLDGLEKNSNECSPRSWGIQGCWIEYH